MTEQEREEIVAAIWPFLCAGDEAGEGVCAELCAGHYCSAPFEAARLADALAPLIAARERAAAEAMREACAVGVTNFAACLNANGSWGPAIGLTAIAAAIRALPLPSTKSAQPETDAT